MRNRSESLYVGCALRTIVSRGGQRRPPRQAEAIRCTGG